MVTLEKFAITVILTTSRLSVLSVKLADITSVLRAQHRATNTNAIAKKHAVEKKNTFTNGQIQKKKTKQYILLFQLLCDIVRRSFPNSVKWSLDFNGTDILVMLSLGFSVNFRQEDGSRAQIINQEVSTKLMIATNMLDVDAARVNVHGVNEELYA